MKHQSIGFHRLVSDYTSKNGVLAVLGDKMSKTGYLKFNIEMQQWPKPCSVSARNMPFSLLYADIHRILKWVSSLKGEVIDQI